MKTVSLVVGHGPRIDKGAENHDGTTELFWNDDLAHRIHSILELDPNIKPIVIHRRVERVAPYTAVNEVDSDFCVEFHLNSFDTRASGTEMIHYPGSTKGARLAAILLMEVVEVLQLPNRGVKTPFNGRGNQFLRATRCPAVIAESGFIDNDHDLFVLNSNKQRLVEAYARGLIRFAEEL